MSDTNEYTPVYWNDIEPLPALTGLYGKEIIAGKPLKSSVMKRSRCCTFHGHDVPLAVQNLNQSVGHLHRTFNTSGMGCGNDVPLMDDSGYAEEDNDNGYDANGMIEEDGTFIVRKMGLNMF